MNGAVLPVPVPVPGRELDFGCVQRIHSLSMCLLPSALAPQYPLDFRGSLLTWSSGVINQSIFFPHGCEHLLSVGLYLWRDVIDDFREVVPTPQL